jgi:hypothetical protein
MRTLYAVIVALCLACLLGCDAEPPRPLVVPNPPPPAEIPVANLPLLLREWNWTDARGSGSCVHASTVYHLRWQHQLARAEHWRKTYAGGETATSILAKWRREGIPYDKTEEGDPAFLDRVTATRRGAIIWFFPYHCVHFCGFATVDGKQYGVVCDNNRIEKYLRIPREEFITKWREYGGFAASALYSPLPPLPWTAYRPANQ